MSKRLLLIFNPKSGMTKVREQLCDIIDTLVKKGYDVTAYPTQQHKDAISIVSNRASEFDRIVIAGGDGTLDEAVNGMMMLPVAKRVPIGYLPCGSTNDFAFSLGLSTDLIEAADTAGSDNIFSCDIGAFNDEHFVYVAAFGAFTSTSYETPQNLKNTLGHFAYILEGTRQLMDVPRYAVMVEYDGNSLYDEYIFGMVTNTNSVGGLKLKQDVSLNDGLFEVTLIRTPKNIIELNQILGYISGIGPKTDLILKFTTNEISFKFTENVAFTLDGEFGGEHSDVIIKNIEKAIEFVVE